MTLSDIFWYAGSRSPDRITGATRRPTRDPFSRTGTDQSILVQRSLVW